MLTSRAQLTSNLEEKRVIEVVTPSIGSRDAAWMASAEAAYPSRMKRCVSPTSSVKAPTRYVGA